MKLGLASKLVDIREVVALNREKRYRVFLTPIGAPVGDRQLVVGEAVPWKNEKKREGESIDAYIGRIAKLTKRGTFNGLKKAIAVSKETAGYTGMAEVLYPDGIIRTIPYKSAMQAVKAGHIPEEAVRPIGYISLRKAVAATA